MLTRSPTPPPHAHALRDRGRGTAAARRRGRLYRTGAPRTVQSTELARLARPVGARALRVRIQQVADLARIVEDAMATLDLKSVILQVQIGDEILYD